MEVVHLLFFAECGNAERGGSRFMPWRYWEISRQDLTHEPVLSDQTISIWTPLTVRLKLSTDSIFLSSVLRDQVADSAPSNSAHYLSAAPPPKKVSECKIKTQETN